MKIILKGFSPVLDSLVQEVGPMAALVYARVYRFCQLERERCDASLETIASTMNVNRKTVERHLKVLVDKGYVTDLDPEVKHRPHRYVTSGKAELEMEIAIGQTKSLTRSDKKSDPRSDKLSDKDTVQEDTEQDTSMGAGAPEDPPEPPEPVKEEKPIPVNIGQWLTGLKEEKNPVAYLVFAYQTLYPEAPPVDYGKMGALKNKAGGAEQTLRYMFKFSGQGLTDPITYIVAAHKGKTGQKKGGGQNGRSDTGPAASTTDPTGRTTDSVEEQYRRNLKRAGLG